MDSVEEEQTTPAIFPVVISFKVDPLSVSDLEAELKHMMSESWDWKVGKMSDAEFLVEFPSLETLRMSTRNGRLYLPIKEREAEIREAFLEPKPSVVLEKVWVQLGGVPKEMRTVDGLKAGLTMVGRPIHVDELSLFKRPVRVQFQCCFLDRIKGSVQDFVNGEGYIISLKIELGGRSSASGSGGPPKPPSQPEDSVDEDTEDRGFEDDEAFNKHRKGKDKAINSTDGTRTTPGNRQVQEGSKKICAVLEKEGTIDQYGSNLMRSSALSFLDIVGARSLVVRGDTS
ncbi:hypothetical protein ACQ4PT_000521 [Festuca glaucescens]